MNRKDTLMMNFFNCIPEQFRALFAMSLIYANLIDPTQPINTLLVRISEDCIRYFDGLNRQYQPNDPIIGAHAADDVSTHLS